MKNFGIHLIVVLILVELPCIVSAQYCAGPDYYNDDTEYITSVKFNSIDNITGSNAPSKYGDYTAQSTSVVRGNTYNIEVTWELCCGYQDDIHVYIDWNADKDWSDAGEVYVIGASVGANGSNTVDLDITVPGTAVVGVIEMRVSCVEEFQGGIACEGSTLYGETEDYTVNVTSALPIELLYFSARRINEEAVLLEWATATELENNYFTIEYSDNALLWHVLKTRPGEGTSLAVHEYREIDQGRTNGTWYYRLKQTDFNGHVTYSEISQITIFKAVKINKIFPNPAVDLAHLNIHSKSSGVALMLFYDTKGKKIKSQDVALVAGENSVLVDVSGIATGCYIARVMLQDGKSFDQAQLQVE